MNENTNMSEQLSAYLDGELSEAETREVERAVAKAPSLAAELESLRATRSLLRQIAPVRPASNFAGQVVETARRRGLLRSRSDGRGRRIGLGRGLRWWVWASAAVVLIAVGVGLMVIVPGLQRQQGRQTEWAGEIPATKPADGAGETSLARAEKRPVQSRSAAGRLAEEAGAVTDDVSQPLAVQPEAMSVETLYRQAAVNEVIWTDDLPTELRNVERLLQSNAIAVVPAPRESPTEPTGQKLLLNQAANVNESLGAKQSRTLAPADTGGQVQFVVYGTEEQLSRLRKQLDRQVRARQAVSQAPAERESQRAADAEANPPHGLAMMQQSRRGLQDRDEKPKGQFDTPMSRQKPIPENAGSADGAKADIEPAAGSGRQPPAAAPEPVKGLEGTQSRESKIQQGVPAERVLLITLRHRSREIAPSTRPASGPSEE
jgi:anti-sigma factor RsiW